MLNLNEALPLEKIYRGAKEYIIKQGGQARVDRIEKGEMWKYMIGAMKVYVYAGTGTVDFITQVPSQTDTGKVYKSRFIATDMLIEDAFTPETPVKVRDSGNKEIFYIQRITPETEVMVRCGCPDFRFRFEWWLKADRALIGRPRPYQRKTTRKSQNVGRVRTVCKHLFALYELLVELGAIGLSERSGREIDLTRYF